MAIIMKGNRLAIIGVNTGSGDDRTPEITADIFGNLMRIADTGFGINIKTLWAQFINQRFHGREGRTETSSQTIKQSGSKGKAEEVEIEMTDFAPRSFVAGGPFGNKDADMRVPLEITAKGVEDGYKTGGEVFRTVDF